MAGIRKIKVGNVFYDVKDTILSYLCILQQLEIERLKLEILELKAQKELCIIGNLAPTVAPDFVGQRYLDIKNKKEYVAFRVTGALTDWYDTNN